MTIGAFYLYYLKSYTSFYLNSIKLSVSDSSEYTNVIRGNKYVLLTLDVLNFFSISIRKSISSFNSIGVFNS